MSVAMEILEGLWNTHLYYKGMRVNFFGVHRPWKPSEAYLRSTLSKIHKKGFVKNKNGIWSITEKGRIYYDERKVSLKKFKPPFKKNQPKNLIIMFDIPEIKRGERGWLRWHLKKFWYSMIQKSVWVGPSPLSKDFIAYIKKIKLDKYIKTFKLAKPYKI